MGFFVAFYFVRIVISLTKPLWNTNLWNTKVKKQCLVVNLKRIFAITMMFQFPWFIDLYISFLDSAHYQVLIGTLNHLLLKDWTGKVSNETHWCFSTNAITAWVFFRCSLNVFWVSDFDLSSPIYVSLKKASS